MVIAETLTVIVTSITLIFNALRNTSLDGISLLLIFVLFMILDVMIEFVFRVIRKDDNKGQKVTIGTRGK